VARATVAMNRQRTSATHRHRFSCHTRGFAALPVEPQLRCQRDTWDMRDT
jgi:hypothetical protein